MQDAREADQPDLINHPPHYTRGSMEVIDAIEGLKLGFHEGNIVKYVARWPHKGGVQDLLKARWYLHRLIDANSHGGRTDADGQS